MRVISLRHGHRHRKATWGELQVPGVESEQLLVAYFPPDCVGSARLPQIHVVSISLLPPDV